MVCVTFVDGIEHLHAFSSTFFPLSNQHFMANCKKILKPFFWIVKMCASEIERKIFTAQVKFKSIDLNPMCRTSSLFY